MTMLELWCGGVPLSTYGMYGDLTPTIQWGPDVIGGLQSVEWTQPTLAGAAVVPAEYVVGTQLELRDSGVVVGQCILGTVDFGTGSFTAWGIAAAPTKLTPTARNTSGAPVYSVHDAVTNAIAAGKLPGWRDPGNLSTLDLRTLTDGNQLDGSTRYNVSDVIATYCRTTSATTRAYIDPAGFLRFAEDATTPSVLLDGVEPFSLTSDNYVDTLVTDYQTFTVDPDTSAFVRGTVISTRPTPSGLSGVEQTGDITGHGSLTQAQAQEASDLALARLLPEYDRDGSRDVTPSQVTTLDGTPIPLTMIPLGALVRHPGARLSGGSMIPGIADEWTLGTLVISSQQGLVSGATMTPLVSSTNVLQAIMSTAVQAQQTATSAAAAAKAATDPLASLLGADKPNSTGPSIPASAVLGQTYFDPGGQMWVCTLAYSSGGTLAGNWTLDTFPGSKALVLGWQLTANIQAANDALTTLNDTTLPALQADLSTLQGKFPITGTEISDGAVSTPQLAANSVTTEKLVAEAVSADKLAANSVSADKVTANFFAAATITGDQIFGGTITGTDLESTGGGRKILISGGELTVSDANGSDTLYFAYPFTRLNTGLSASGPLQSAQVQTPNVAAPIGDLLSLNGTPSPVSGYNPSGVVLPSLAIGGSPIAAYVGGASGQLLSGSSSRRFKTEIRNLVDTYPVPVLRQIAVYLFRWIGHPDIEDGTKDSGVLAEELVKLGLDVLVIRDRYSNPSGVHYDRLTVFALALSQAAWDELDAHAELIAELQDFRTQVTAALAAAGITVPSASQEEA